MTEVISVTRTVLDTKTSDEKLSDQEYTEDIAPVNERSTTEARLLRKLDVRFLPTVFLIYLMNYIDRTAIATARLKGLEEDLGLSDIQYDTAVAILYASYCSAQIPSNMILNRIKRPSLYIGCCVVAWGLTSALTGITRNYAGILSCRLFLGFPEAAFYPGAIYLLSRWYTRKELAFRASLFYSGSLLSTAFGNLMAAGILANLEEKRGIRGWRWLFFIEGALTISVGIIAMWSLPDLPNNTRWISVNERQLAQARLAEDTGEADEDLAQDSMWEGLKMAVKDVRVLIFALMEMSLLLGLSFVNFFPTLTATLGFDTTITLLLAADKKASVDLGDGRLLFELAACWYAYRISYYQGLTGGLADKTGERFWHLSLPWWGAIAGTIVALSTSSITGRYISLFLMASGFAGFTLILVWLSNTITRPPAKRAASIGLVNGVGNVGNLIGSYTWKAKWGPQYHRSMEIGVAALLFSVSLASVMRFILVRKNKRLDEDEIGGLKGANQKRIEDAACLEGITMEEAMERKKGFRYLY
ncbi:MFS transporter [Sanghuangporus baumii]|uniref:MFS transporter n=1 Tax=Sanghuangporus baumii TaxID=108892 RepID=A0A9Q5HSI1_SANBA|nr:MFS transporter [Sanghuangporus baumii]